MNEKINKDKLTDKAFVRSVAAAVLSVLMCLVCLCSATWAWFTGSVANSDNEIKAADGCRLTVKVAEDGAELLSIGDDAEHTGSLKLAADVEYTVTLELPAESASGYCVITDASGIEHRTNYIPRHSGEPVKVELTLTTAETQTVEFAVRWGIYSDECSVIDGKIPLPASN